MAAILWQVHKVRTIHRRLAADARISRASADQGYAMAQYVLGLMYEKGQGVPQGDAEAVRRYAKVAVSCFAKTQESRSHWYASDPSVTSH